MKKTIYATVALLPLLIFPGYGQPPGTEITGKPAVARTLPVEKKRSGCSAIEGRMPGPWSLGAHIGLPFFWGDFTSVADKKTYIGFSAGVQASYRISRLFGLTLSFDWAQNKAGSRGYAAGYLLDPNGMTWYTPQTATTQEYRNLYSRINMYNLGLHFDVNVLGIFDRRAGMGPFQVILSPAVYAQRFSSKVYTSSDDAVYVGKRLSKNMSLGLGGDLALRYSVSRAVAVQLKGTGIWITDNGFDNILTVGYVKQNAMWGISAGVVWTLGR